MRIQRTLLSCLLLAAGALTGNAALAQCTARIVEIVPECPGTPEDQGTCVTVQVANGNPGTMQACVHEPSRMFFDCEPVAAGQRASVRFELGHMTEAQRGALTAECMREQDVARASRPS